MSCHHCEALQLENAALRRSLFAIQKMPTETLRVKCEALRECCQLLEMQKSLIADARQREILLREECDRFRLNWDLSRKALRECENELHERENSQNPQASEEQTPIEDHATVKLQKATFKLQSIRLKLSDAENRMTQMSLDLKSKNLQLLETERRLQWAERSLSEEIRFREELMAFCVK